MLLVVGRLGRPHGLRGELTVEVRTDEAEQRFAPGARLVTEPAAAGPLTVGSARWHGDRLLLTFDGVADRTAAEGLRGVLLQAEVDPSEVPEDPEEFYDHQLLDLPVHDQDGRYVGTVAEVVHLPGQDLLAVRREDGRREALVPFVAQFVPVVDPVTGIVIAPPPGLLSLDEDA